jgi:transposase
VVAALQALRGVQGTVAVTTVAALGALTRCDPPRALMKFLGRIPAAYSTGERRRQGARTTAGTTPARRALVEGAWASRSPAQVRRHRPLRREKHPKALPAIRWKAQVRPCQRDRTLIAHGKHANQVVVAMARALMGFLWAIAQEGPGTPYDQDGS